MVGLEQDGESVGQHMAMHGILPEGTEQIEIAGTCAGTAGTGGGHAGRKAEVRRRKAEVERLKMGRGRKGES
jgi:hypothetical protein